MSDVRVEVLELKIRPRRAPMPAHTSTNSTTTMTLRRLLRAISLSMRRTIRPVTGARGSRRVATEGSELEVALVAHERLAVAPREAGQRDQQRRDAVHARPQEDGPAERVDIGAQRAGVDRTLYRGDEVVEGGGSRLLDRVHVPVDEPRPAHEHDPGRLGMLEPEPYVGLAPELERLDRVVAGRGSRLERGVEDRELAVAHREQ